MLVDFGQCLSEQQKDFLSLEEDTQDKLSVLIMKYTTNISVKLSVLAGMANRLLQLSYIDRLVILPA